jgi:hypothetical protein
VDVGNEPEGTVTINGFGLAKRPRVPPLMTVKLTGKLNCPASVFTNTVPLTVPEIPVGFGKTDTWPVPELNAPSQLCPDVDTDVIATGEPLKVILTLLMVLADPDETVILTGFGLAASPDDGWPHNSEVAVSSHKIVSARILN